MDREKTLIFYFTKNIDQNTQMGVSRSGRWLPKRDGQNYLEKSFSCFKESQKTGSYCSLNVSQWTDLLRNVSFYVRIPNALNAACSLLKILNALNARIFALIVSVRLRFVTWHDIALTSLAVYSVIVKLQKAVSPRQSWSITKQDGNNRFQHFILSQWNVGYRTMKSQLVHSLWKVLAVQRELYC